MRRLKGDVRAAILALLVKGSRNGYQIISEIDDRSGGAWRPSPGAIYPALSQLAREGLIAAEESGGRRTFSLTDAGRARFPPSGGGSNAIPAPWPSIFPRRVDECLRCRKRRIGHKAYLVYPIMAS